jgi:8-oxo-dGTP pyrophosphatase MutT (NUDIX family)
MKKVISAGGFVIDGSKVLLIRLEGGKYAIPKGHVELNESFDQTALREVEEETGVVAEILSYLGDYTRPSNENNGELVEKTIKIYLMNKVGYIDKKHDEISEWVDIEEALQKMHFLQEANFIEQILK